MNRQVNKTFIIPNRAARLLKERISKINRRARRLGLEPIELERLQEVGLKEYRVPVEGSTLDFRSVNLWASEYRMTGEIPVVPGDHTLEAVTDFEPATGVRTYLWKRDGLELADNGMTARCDHCNKERRRRRYFHIRTGDQVRVLGSSCVRDFLPTIDPNHLATIAEWNALADLLDQPDQTLGLEGALMVDPLSGLWETVEILGLAIRHAKRTSGYISLRASEGTNQVPTAESVRLDLANRVLPNDEERDQAAKVLRFLAEIETGSTYLENLKALAGAGLVAENHIGILASGISVYTRLKAKAARDARPVSLVHVGTIGERITVKVTLDEVQAIAGSYGTTTIHKFRSGSADLVWFCSGTPLDIEPGQSVEIVGTVKKHGEFRGSKTTTINRVKIA